MAIGETVITIVGNLTADPELRTTQSGKQVCNVTVASTPRIFDRQTNQWTDGQALFLRCTAWGDFATHIASSMSKGMRVIAQGRLTQRSWQDEQGANHTVIEMQLDEIGPSLRYATAWTRPGPPPSRPPPPLHSRRPSTPASVAGANGRNSRRRHSNPPSLRPMIRGARRRPTSHHSEVSANPTRNRISKEQQ